MADAFTSDTYNALCRDAEDYLGRGLTEQARELLLKAVSLIGTRSRARSLLADACMSLGLWSEAREQLEQLITLELGSVQHHYRLGQVLEELEEKENALDNYRVVLDLERDHRGASVAVTRLTGRPQDARPEEPASPVAKAPAAAPTQPAGASGSFQVFPDEAGAEDVFATSGEVESLLRDIGVVQPVDSETGVAELLSSVGINLDLPGPPEEAPPVEVKDISTLMGSPAGESGDEFSLQSVFGNSPEPEAGEAAEAAPPSAEAAPEEQAQTFDFTSIFKSVPGQDGQPAKPESPDADRSPAAPSEPGPFPVSTAASADLEKSPVQGGQTPILESIFAGPEQAPATQAPEPEAPSEPVKTSEPEAPAPDAPAPEAPVQVLESVFAEPEEAPEPEAASEPPIQAVSPAGSAVEAMPPGPMPGEAPEELPPLEPVFTSVSEAAVPPLHPDRGPEGIEVQVTVAEDSGIQTQQPEQGVSLEIVYGPPPEAAPEDPPAVPAGEEPAGPAGDSEPALFDIHPTSSDELMIIDLMEGRVEAKLAFVAAMDGSVIIAEEGSRRILAGTGTVVLGQSPRIPVVLILGEGDLVRRDRIALCDAAANFSEARDSVLPSMFRVEGRGGAAVAFSGGRCSTLSLAGGRDLLVRAAGIVQITKGIEAVQDPGNPGFVRLRGDGSVLVSS